MKKLLVAIAIVGLLAVTAVKAHDDVKGKQEELLKLEGPVVAAIWTPTGTLFASVATRKEKREGGGEFDFDYFTTVRIHDAKTGKEITSLGELKNPGYVHRLFAPDGKTLALSVRKSA